MAASPIPMQLEYVDFSATERSENRPGKFNLVDCMQILSLLITLVGLVGNGLVLWLLGFRIQRNPFSVYVLNLAGADALYLCSSFLMIINHFVRYIDFFSVSVVMEYLTSMPYTVGLSLLAAISFERCLAVLFPIWYRVNRPKHTSVVMCTGLWAVTALLWGTAFVVCYSMLKHDVCNHFRSLALVWFLLLAPVLGVSSLTLLLRVQCSSQRRQPPKLYLLVLLNVLVFLLCGLPLGTVTYISFWYRRVLPSWVLQLLACVNSSANPFIYFFLGRQRPKRRKETLRVILQRALEDKQDLGTAERNTHTHTMTLRCHSEAKSKMLRGGSP